MPWLSMNLTFLEEKLMAAARKAPVNEHVPYAFERRIMARLATTRPLDVLGWWGHALCRAAVPCLAITLLLGAWTLWDAQRAQSDFGKEFETASRQMPANRRGCC